MLELDYRQLPEYTIDDLHRAVAGELQANKGTYHNWIKRVCHDEEHDDARLRIKQQMKDLNMTQAVGSRYKRDAIADAAWFLMMELYPPKMYQEAGKKKAEAAGEEDELVLVSGLAERVEVCVVDDVIWAYENMYVVGAENSEHCPGSGAYGLLVWARKNVDAFYKNLAVKAFAVREKEVDEAPVTERLLKDTDSYNEYRNYLRSVRDKAQESAAG